MKKVFIILFIIILLCGCKKDNISNNNQTNYLNNQIINPEIVFEDNDSKQDFNENQIVKSKIINNQNIEINETGIYEFSGNIKNTTIVINSENEIINIILNNLNIENDNKPCIFIKNANKVVITLKGNNIFRVDNKFEKDDLIKGDAVIYSKHNITFNGDGILNINSSDNGISCNDSIKIMNGNININSLNDGIEANNYLAIDNGIINITSQKDGIQIEDNKDDSIGFLLVNNGIINIDTTDDAIHATTFIQINGGTFNLKAHEGIEATYVQINNGIININASDDAINAGRKSSKYIPTIEFNGGSTIINMDGSDNDAIDSNGNIYINNGIIDIKAKNPFDYKGSGIYYGGTIIVNGKIINSIEKSNIE